MSDAVQQVASSPSSQPSQAPQPKKTPLLLFGIGIMLVILLASGAFLLLTSNSQQPPLGKETPTSITIHGTVVRNDTTPIEGVAVSGMNNEHTTTDAFGRYEITIATTQNTTLTFRKEGFVPLHKAITQSEKTITLDTQLYPSQKFEKVTLPAAVSITMNKAALSAEKDSFVIKGTQTKATSANISLTPFDPANPKEVGAFPGRFEGIQATGTTTALESFGFEKVQVRDDNGNPLDLATGKKAELTIPISPSAYTSSPETIPLWNFDEKLGTWVEKGSATKFCTNGTCVYKGNITTIASWWNADMGIEGSGILDVLFGITGELWKGLTGAADWIGNKVLDAGSWIGSLFSGKQNTGFPENYTMSTDLAKLKAQAGPDDVIVHVSWRDEPGKPMYEIVSKSDIAAWEASQSSQGNWLTNRIDSMSTTWSTAWGDPNSSSFTKAIVGGVGALVALVAPSYTATAGAEDTLKFLDASGSQYNSWNTIQNYVATLDSGMSESSKVESIYNEVQSVIHDNQSVANNYNIAQALQNSEGVCRDKAAILATSLANAGITSAVVYDGTHAWTRVTYSNGTVNDLDPNAYQTYNPLTPRNVGTSQVVPTSQYFTPWYGHFSDIPQTTKVHFDGVPTTTNLVAPAQNYTLFCAENNFCIDLNEQIIVDTSDSESVEFITQLQTIPLRVNILSTSSLTFDANNTTYAHSFATTLLGAQTTVYPIITPTKTTDVNIYYYFTGTKTSDGKTGIVTIVSGTQLSQDFVSSVLNGITFDPTATKTPFSDESTNPFIPSDTVPYDTNGPTGDALTSALANFTPTITLTGVDYSSQSTYPAHFNENGTVTINGGKKIMGKPNGKALVRLDMQGIMSEGIPVTIPEAGKSLTLNMNYAGIIVPVVLTDANSYASVNIKVMDENNNDILATQRYLSTGNASDGVFFLISPRESVTVIIEGIFSPFYKKVVLHDLTANSIKQLTQVRIGGKPLAQSAGAALAYFNCPAHYAYIATEYYAKDVNGPADSWFDALYYDGNKIDSSEKIDEVTLFGNHLAYTKRVYLDENGAYCGAIRDTNTALCSITDETHVIYDGNDMGVGDEIKLDGDHIGFRREARDTYYGRYDFIYDGVSKGAIYAHYSNGPYYLQGGHFAFNASLIGDNDITMTDENTWIVWDDKNLGFGLIKYLEKDFLYAELTKPTYDDANREVNYALYKNGVLVDGVNYEWDIQTFGNHWAASKEPKTLYYDGKKLFESTDYGGVYAQLFGDNILYGAEGYDNPAQTFLNGEKLPYGIYCNPIDMTYLCDRGALYESHAAIVLKSGFYLDGKTYLTDREISKVLLSGTNWLAWDDNKNIFFNDAFVGVSCSQNEPLLVGAHYAFPGCKPSDWTYGDRTYPLIFDGTSIGKEYDGDFRIFGDHIIWRQNDLNESRLMTYLDGNMIWKSDLYDTSTFNSVIHVFPESGEQYGDIPFKDTWQYCTQQK